MQPLSDEEFDAIVEDALDEVPTELMAMLDNVVFLVEPEPPADDPDLLGVYDGVPLTERGDAWAAGALPDRITLFRGPLTRMCRDVEELTEDVRTRLLNSKRLEQASAARDAVLEKVLDMVEVPVPDAVVAEELQARRQSVEQQLSFAGMTMEQYLDNEKQTSTSSRPSSRSGSGTPSPPSSSSTRSPRPRRSGSSSRSSPSTCCAVPSSRGRTRTSTCST